MPSLAPMLDAITPAVVNIATYTTVQVRNPLMDDPFFRRFFNLPEQQQRYRRTQGRRVRASSSMRGRATSLPTTTSSTAPTKSR